MPDVRDEIRRLDPESDHQRIVHLNLCWDFPWDTLRALEFALFRTFAVPSISSLLDRTAEFARRPQRRYDDTGILIAEMLEFGHESDRGTRALRRMNEIHARFRIANDDYLYVLSTFAFEPSRWNRRFGWRPFLEAERQAYFHFWRAVGDRMGIRDVPPTADEFDAWSRAYERDRFRPAGSNRRVAEATRDLFLSRFPRPLRPVVEPAVRALLDEPVLRAFGFEAPPPATRRAVEALLRARASLVRQFPRRRRAFHHTSRRGGSYPDGYVIERVGPPCDPATPAEAPPCGQRTLGPGAPPSSPGQIER